MSYASSMYRDTPKSNTIRAKASSSEQKFYDSDDEYKNKSEILIKEDKFKIESLKNTKNNSYLEESTSNDKIRGNTGQINTQIKNNMSEIISNRNQKTINNYMNKTKYSQSLNYKIKENFNSRKLNEPIINKEAFYKSLTKDDIKIEGLQLKLLDYPTLKEIIEKCGSYPKKFRNYIWKFLLSLPNDRNLFEIYSSKGVHPFYKDLELTSPVKDQKYFRKLKQICSVVSFWSPHVGNVYFLPNLIFPFIKSIKGDDLFLFELIVAFLISYSQFWFEFYPGAPLNHLKLFEKIIEKEKPKLYRFLKLKEEEFNSTSIKISELIWCMLKNNFSENLIKENWLQYMDFILTYSHKPEIILYFATSFLIKKEYLILKCKTREDIENVIFGIEKNANFNFMSVFNLTRNLMEKYAKYQIYVYRPYLPFNEEYPCIDKFPLDFLETTAKLREDLFYEETNHKIKLEKIDEMENNFLQLLRKEEMIQKTYECLVHREKEKAELMKKELNLIMFQKAKFYEEIKNKKLEKVGRLNKVIDGSLKFYNDMNKGELNSYDEEMRKRKYVEKMDLKQRLQHEELNNLEFEANRKMMQLLNLRDKDEMERKFKSEEEIRNKDRDLTKRLLEDKWKIEDEEMLRKIENLRNLKEFEVLKKKEGNDVLYKEQIQKLNEFETNLMIQQVERERKNRQIQHELEMNKILIENQIDQRKEILLKEEKNEIDKIIQKELDMTKHRKKEHYELILNKIKENMNLVDEEEKTLIEYEHILKKKEIENKINEIRKRGELNVLEDEKSFHEQMIKLEEQKRQHLVKKEELEMKKENLINNLNNVINELKNNQNDIVKEQRQNFNNFKNVNYEETQKQLGNIKNSNNNIYRENYGLINNYTEADKNNNYNSKRNNNNYSPMRNDIKGLDGSSGSIKNDNNYYNSNNNYNHSGSYSESSKNQGQVYQPTGSESNYYSGNNTATINKSNPNFQSYNSNYTADNKINYDEYNNEFNETKYEHNIPELQRNNIKSLGSLNFSDSQ